MPEPLVPTQVDTRTRCVRCGTELAPRLLVCPACHALVHAERLTQLASEAEYAERQGQMQDALERYREALGMLPPSAPQYATIGARVDALVREVEKAPSKRDAGLRAKLAGKGAIAGAILLALWKFKFVAVFLLTKGKLLLLGLTKMGTLGSMLLSLGVYWTAWGWKFALGLILSMYVHEMGHVAALRRYGIPASAPMFVPGFGAFVRLKQALRNEREDAQVGLAGPLWGLGATAASLLLWVATDAPIFLGVAFWSAMLNLFNLAPIWQLDGGRGFNAMSRVDRIIAAGIILVALLAVRHGILLILLLLAIVKVFTAPAREPDRRALALFSFLVLAFSAVLALPPPVLP